MLNKARKQACPIIAGIVLERNGHILNASEEEATAAIMALASSQLTEEAFAHWFQDHCT